MLLLDSLTLFYPVSKQRENPNLHTFGAYSQNALTDLISCSQVGGIIAIFLLKMNRFFMVRTALKKTDFL